MLVVTSNYFRRFCDKLQHLLDIPTPSLDACSAACSVDYQRQVYLNFLQVKGRLFLPSLFHVEYVNFEQVCQMNEWVSLTLYNISPIDPKFCVHLVSNELFNLLIQKLLCLSCLVSHD